MSFDKNRAHLVPISVIDVAESLAQSSPTSNQSFTYQARLEAIKDYAEHMLVQHYAKTKQPYFVGGKKA
jgi:hypothetical protein